MNRKSKHARLLELGKDVLIVLLACSAVWLTTRVQRTGSLGDLLADTPQEGQGQTQAPGQMERPPSAMGHSMTSRAPTPYSSRWPICWWRR